MNSIRRSRRKTGWYASLKAILDSALMLIAAEGFGSADVESRSFGAVYRHIRNKDDQTTVTLALIGLTFLPNVPGNLVKAIRELKAPYRKKHLLPVAALIDSYIPEKEQEQV